MESEPKVEVSRTQKKFRSGWVETLRQTASIMAQEEITQSSGCVEAKGLLSLFLVPLFPCSYAGFSLGSESSCLLAVGGLMATTTTVWTKIVVKISLMFLVIDCFLGVCANYNADRMQSAEEVTNECRNRIRDGTRKGQGQCYAGVREVWRECRRCRVESTECGGWVMEDGSVGVRTWLQLMCCTLTKEQVCP